VAGSDILHCVWKTSETIDGHPLKVFFFGGTSESSQKACTNVNQDYKRNVICVGHLCPGFGTVDEMSADAIINTVNAAKADFVIVALGARKGQSWIVRNMAKLDAPVISHLGATINFIAGSVQRAPQIWQQAGLEWCWRIKQEPHLARRYWVDFKGAFWLLFTRLLPLAIWLRWSKWRWADKNFSMTQLNLGRGCLCWKLEGCFAGDHVRYFNHQLNSSCVDDQIIKLDLSKLMWADTAAMGSLLMLYESACKDGAKLVLVGTRPALRLAFRLNGLGELLTNP